MALTDADTLASMSCVPSGASETRWVDGVQPDAAPAHVSRTNTSATPFVSLSTRFIAEETKTTYRPSALIDGEMLSPSDGLLLSPTEARVTEGSQPEGAPVQVSRTKMLRVDPGISVEPLVEARTITV